MECARRFTAEDAKDAEKGRDGRTLLRQGYGGQAANGTARGANRPEGAENGADWGKAEPRKEAASRSPQATRLGEWDAAILRQVP
jgi:hypothetical protein